MLLSVLLFVQPVHAEISAGSNEVQAYELLYRTTVVGYLVVVSDDATNPPPGYTVGDEHWAWTYGPAWRGAFRLEETSTVPIFSSYNWDQAPHCEFDLTASVGMPSITLGTNDTFYKVLRRDDSTPPLLETVAYLWLKGGDPADAVWYGVDGVLASPLIDTNDDHIKMHAIDDPPAAGSIDVHLLDIGDEPG